MNNLSFQENNFSFQQLEILSSVFISEKHRDNFLLNVGKANATSEIECFNNYFDIDKCLNFKSWSEDDLDKFDSVISNLVIKRWVWPVTLRALNASMALNEERVGVTGSHLL